MRLFKLKPDKSTMVAAVLGIAIILLSVSMTLFNKTSPATFMNIVIRDFLMIYVLGFCFPLLYVQKNEAGKYGVLGITKDKLAGSLILNVAFAVVLWGIFRWKISAPITFSYPSIYAISYILVAGIFEMICIYGFIRHYLEKAFGIIPAILLTAIVYSLHHAGFQPEFAKLFFVGVMYCSVFYITRNIFIVFPFFWGAGAVWDVLINSTAGQSLQSTTTLFVAMGLLTAMCLFIFAKVNVYEHERKSKKPL